MRGLISRWRHPTKCTSGYPDAGAYPLVPPGAATRRAWAPSMTIPLVIGVDPLQTTLLELGIVSGRVALLPRSAEIQPGFVRFVLSPFTSSITDPSTPLHSTLLTLPNPSHTHTHTHTHKPSTLQSHNGDLCCEVLTMLCWYE